LDAQFEVQLGMYNLFLKRDEFGGVEGVGLGLQWGCKIIKGMNWVAQKKATQFISSLYNCT
jgi:hypothetical protein